MSYQCRDVWVLLLQMSLQIHCIFSSHIVAAFCFVFFFCSSYLKYCQTPDFFLPTESMVDSQCLLLSWVFKVPRFIQPFVYTLISGWILSLKGEVPWLISISIIMGLWLGDSVLWWTGTLKTKTQDYYLSTNATIFILTNLLT